MNNDTISRQAAIDELWKALYEYEDRTEKQFQESADLDVGDWIGHRIFVQNMSDIDRQTILNLPSTEKTGKWIKMSDADGVYWVCSECGEDIPRISHYNPQFDLFPRLESINKTNYCPNCGAKMEE